MKNFKVDKLLPNIDCESVTILKTLTKAARSLAELKGEINRIFSIDINSRPRKRNKRGGVLLSIYSLPEAD